MTEETSNQTRTRTCNNPICTESLSYRNGDPITEQFAIELGQWLTVTGESLQARPGGLEVVVDCKTFCTSDCLEKYLAIRRKEYEDAEDRAVVKMLAAAEKRARKSAKFLEEHPETEEGSSLTPGTIPDLADEDKPDMERLQRLAKLFPAVQGGNA
jgi:hypothetical protein